MTNIGESPISDEEFNHFMKVIYSDIQYSMKIVEY